MLLLGFHRRKRLALGLIYDTDFRDKTKNKLPYRIQKVNNPVSFYVLVIQPYSPDANFEMALVCHETGRKDDALDYLNRALSVWENADPDFEPAIKARAILAEWEQ